MKSIESIPNAARTFNALRSLGYDLNSSVADVVDNAVTDKVKGKLIRVSFNLTNNGKITCRIQDDGCGMSEKQLEEAMRLGADASYEDTDLGKFGMGMKTASLSHCNKLTVISKRKNGSVAGCCWDMAHVKKAGWTLFKLSPKESEEILRKENLSIGPSGTIVFWDDLFLMDRELKALSNEGFRQNYFHRKLAQVKLHLRMVYHRFLDGSLGKSNTIKILVNDEVLKPWDPFAVHEPSTREVPLKKELASLKIENFKEPILIKGYILPTKESFSSEAAWKEAKGLNSWNDSQGYYIYRANRIIRFGGWNNTKAKDEHDKLARICL
ncbi:MAG: ATP-binding protein, partial [Chitinophagaceae bacterium]|nr:ATP-binding protein [Chitinophagaceae bacterium]